MDIVRALNRVLDAFDPGDSNGSDNYVPRTTGDHARFWVGFMFVVLIWIILLWIYFKFGEIGKLMF